MSRVARRFLMLGGMFLIAFLVGVGGEFYKDAIRPMLFPASPTASPHPTPSSAPRWSATVAAVPPRQAEPVALGARAVYKGVGVTLQDVSTHDLLYVGEDFGGQSLGHYPLAGDQIIDLLFAVDGAGARLVTVSWKEFALLEEDGSSWYTDFGGFGRQGSAAKIASLNVEDSFDLSRVQSIRLAYFVGKAPQRLVFHIGGIPLIWFDNP